MQTTRLSAEGLVSDYAKNSPNSTRRQLNSKMNKRLEWIFLQKKKKTNRQAIST